MTVDELRKQLEGWPGDWTITFGALQFNRLKKRGDKLVDIELHPLAYFDKATGTWQVTADSGLPAPDEERNS